jgi:hypothetical protein
MSELHFLVVFDTETKSFRVGDLGEMPVDSDESVWDAAADEWRRPTDEESSLAVDAEGVLIHAVHGIGAEITISAHVETQVSVTDGIPVHAEPGSLADRLAGGL